MLKGQSVETGVDVAQHDVRIGDGVQCLFDPLGRQAGWEVDTCETAMAGGDSDGFLAVYDGRPSQPA